MSWRRRVVEFVATASHSYSVCFGLLGTDAADEVGIGDFAILGDLGLLDEEGGAGAFDLFDERAISADAMGEDSAPFVCKATFPGFCIWAEE